MPGGKQALLVCGFLRMFHHLVALCFCSLQVGLLRGSGHFESPAALMDRGRNKVSTQKPYHFC